MTFLGFLAFVVIGVLLGLSFNALVERDRFALAVGLLVAGSLSGAWLLLTVWP